MHAFALLAPILAISCISSGVDTGRGSAEGQMVVYGVLDSLTSLYGQNIIGQPVGHQDVVASCLMGGNAHIVGETSEGGTATLDLVLTLTGCASSGSGYSLVIDGEIEWWGSFRTGGYKDLSTTSESLGVVGEIEAGGEMVQVDETCTLAVTDRGQDGEQSVVQGSWCGEQIAF